MFGFQISSEVAGNRICHRMDIRYKRKRRVKNDPKESDLTTGGMKLLLNELWQMTVVFWVGVEIVLILNMLNLI